MDETEQAGGADASQQGDFNQAEIDALLSGAGDAAAQGEEPADQQNPSAEKPSDGTISQDDIDALMSGNAAAGAPAKSTAAAADSGAVSQADIDALVSAAQDGGEGPQTGEGDAQAEGKNAVGEPDSRLDSMGRPFDEAAAAMEAAIAEERAAAQAAAVPSTPVDLPEFAVGGTGEVDTKRVTMLSDVNLRVKLQLGQTRMLVEDVLKLGEGSVVELNKPAGDPVDVLVNDRLVARGEVLVLNDVFCVRVSEVISHDPHRVTT